MPKELKSSELPPAVAYIRLDEDDDDALFAVFLKEVATCCHWHGLRLTRSFMDRGYDGTQLARPGIAELREALKENPGLAVVVPTLEHLSPAEPIRSALVQLVTNLGGRVVVAFAVDAPNGVSLAAQDAACDEGDR